MIFSVAVVSTHIIKMNSGQLLAVLVLVMLVLGNTNTTTKPSPSVYTYINGQSTKTFITGDILKCLDGSIWRCNPTNGNGWLCGLNDIYWYGPPGECGGDGGAHHVWEAI